MPETWTTLIKFFGLLFTFTVKPVQILLFPKIIKGSIPNTYTRYPNGWFKTSKLDKRTFSRKFVSNFIDLNIQVFRYTIQSNTIACSKLAKQRVAFPNDMRGKIIPAQSKKSHLAI